MTPAGARDSKTPASSTIPDISSFEMTSLSMSLRARAEQCSGCVRTFTGTERIHEGPPPFLLSLALPPPRAPGCSAAVGGGTGFATRQESRELFLCHCASGKGSEYVKCVSVRRECLRRRQFAFIGPPATV